jgi:group I intron endonuclease
MWYTSNQENCILYEIYLITNQINEMKYVGQASAGMKKRFTQHISDAKMGSKGVLHKALRKYGRDRFVISLLATAKDQNDLNRLEVFWIKTLDTKAPNGYNLTDGGGGSSGFVKSEQSRQKMSIVHKGKNVREKSHNFRHDLDIDSIVFLYQQGNSFRKISQKVGADPAAVRLRLEIAGIPIRSVSESQRIRFSNPKNSPTYRGDLSTKDVISLFEKKLTYREIGKTLGCSIDTVRNRLTKAGLFRLPGSGVNREEVAKLCLSGYSQQKVAKQFGISARTVRRILKEREPRATLHQEATGSPVAESTQLFPSEDFILCPVSGWVAV